MLCYDTYQGSFVFGVLESRDRSFMSKFLIIEKKKSIQTRKQVVI